MDPSQRVVLEEGFCALYDAGWNKTSLMGSPVGVYVGGNGNDAEMYAVKVFT